MGAGDTDCHGRKRPRNDRGYKMGILRCAQNDSRFYDGDSSSLALLRMTSFSCYSVLRCRSALCRVGAVHERPARYNLVINARISGEYGSRYVFAGDLCYI